MCAILFAGRRLIPSLFTSNSRSLSRDASQLA